MPLDLPGPGTYNVTASLLLYGSPVSITSVSYYYSPDRDYFVSSPALASLSLSSAPSVSDPQALDPLSSAVEASLSSAELGVSNLPSSVLSMPGMSGKAFRMFMNNLLGSVPAEDRSYLEVGVWSGSTFASALYGNEGVRAVAIDNWSQFGGPKDAFIGNVRRYGAEADVVVLESDC